MTAVDQDGIPADRVIDSGNEQVFDKRQQNGTWDIGVFNTDASASHSFSVSLPQLGLTGPANVTSLWAGTSLGTVNGTFTTTSPLAAHPHLGHARLRHRRDRRTGRRCSPCQCWTPRRGNGRPRRRVHFTSTAAARSWPRANGGINHEFYRSLRRWLHHGRLTECLDVYNNQTAPGTNGRLWPLQPGRSPSVDRPGAGETRPSLWPPGPSPGAGGTRLGATVNGTFTTAVTPGGVTLSSPGLSGDPADITLNRGCGPQRIRPASEDEASRPGGARVVARSQPAPPCLGPGRGRDDRRAGRGLPARRAPDRPGGLAAGHDHLLHHHQCASARAGARFPPSS